MIEIIPTILVKTFKEIKDRIRKVENYVDWVQLDIMDGVFVNNKTWRNPEDLKEFETRAKLEAHLMIEKPEEIIDNWLKVVDRVIIHHETCNMKHGTCDIEQLIKRVHSRGKQIGLAVNPETPIEVVRTYISNKRSDQPSEAINQAKRSTILDLVLCMTVSPGWGGQKFKESVIPKIKSLREMWPDGNIEVDGGINPETAKKCLDAGANLICAGNYIFKSKDVRQAIKSLTINE